MKVDDALDWAAMLACIAVSAHGEWSLAMDCGYGNAVAAGLPVAIDAYAVRAMRAHREIFPPVLLMVATNAAAHLVTARMLGVSPWLVVAVSAIAPVVLWRTHALARNEVQAPAQGLHTVEPVDAMAVVEVERAPEAYPAIEATVPAVPEAVPAGVRSLPIVARPVVPKPSSVEREPVAVSAAEYARTRPEVHAGYVPEPESSDDPTEPEDELTSLAREEFADLLAEDRIPSIRRLRDTYLIGQPRAQLIQRQLGQRHPD